MINDTVSATSKAIDIYAIASIERPEFDLPGGWSSSLWEITSRHHAGVFFNSVSSIEEKKRVVQIGQPLRRSPFYWE